MTERLYVGSRKGLFELTRGPRGWDIARTSFLGEPVSMLLPDPRDGSLYAALALGHFGVKLHRSDDGGARWEELPAPAFPASADGDGPSVAQIWSLEPGGADRPGVLWCGTISGGLFRSADRGGSWQLVESLWQRPERAGWFGGGTDEPGIHSICVDPRDSRRVTVGVSCGGIWTTEDEGGSWQVRCAGMHAAYMPPERREDPNIQDPHRLVQCPAAPDAMWVQHHNGIFRSTDRARSWHEVTAAAPSHFGFAVAVHPTRPDTAWFVPAVKDQSRVPVKGAVTVTRTTDGGRSFETLRGGLPQRHAYDIVYRHALDVDRTGERLAMGSTTGHLWLTEDGGERWAKVGEHLPPIYCVRFAA
ncbi:MAG: hypothetical protein U1E53_08755 [Dongiaceae bacterium]